MQPQENYDVLLAKALEAERAYYELDEPIMSDSEYDAIVRALAAMEDENRFLARSSSPTNRVGGKATNTFEKVNLPYRMLSLRNAFTADDIDGFIAKTLGYAGEFYHVQPKLDGLTLVLFYENGVLVKAATRGNGDVGEDVTLNALNIPSIPRTIQADKLIVRGEVVMHKADFEELNKAREVAGQPLYANARNVAAGSIRQKDPAVTRSRKLTFYAYDMPGVGNISERYMLYSLQMNGFLTPNSITVPVNVPDISTTLYDTIQHIKHTEDSIPYAIDGAVVKTDDRGVGRLELGEGTHDPNWAIAFKFTPMEAITTLKGVIWQVGRKGTMTPVAVLEPVELCGTTVEHASLHNVDYIKEMDLKLGDIVAVYKAAEIIPQLDHVVESMGNALLPIPSICPECGAPLVRSGGPALYCDNEDCPARLKAEICYFVSRQAMDIRGIADAMINWLVDHGKLHSAADIYKLKKEDLLIPGMSKDVKAEAVLAEIEKSKDKPFDRVLCAIGIDCIGTTGAVIIAKHFGSMEALQKATKEEIASIEGFASLSASQITASLHEPRKAQLIADLAAAGLQMTQQVEQLASDKLSGKAFCITGTLSQSRDQIKKLIEENGGKFVTSVSSATSYLVAGEGGGSKRDKAAKLGVTIITEKQLKEMIE